MLTGYFIAPKKEDYRILKEFGKNNDRKNYSQEEIIKLRTQLSAVARESNRTMTELAIRYSLSHPAVATVIPGASSREQLLANITAARTPHLTQEEIEAITIKQISQANRYEQYR